VYPTYIYGKDIQNILKIIFGKMDILLVVGNVSEEMLKQYIENQE